MSETRHQSPNDAGEQFKWLGDRAAEHFGEPSSSILDTFNNRNPENDYWITFECPEFTSLCPVTEQPDFGHITIQYVPDRLCIESKSLKLYLLSFRNSHVFHEEVVNRVMEDLAAVCTPRKIKVIGTFNPRGGISITVEAAKGL